LTEKHCECAKNIHNDHLENIVNDPTLETDYVTFVQIQKSRFSFDSDRRIVIIRTF